MVSVTKQQIQAIALEPIDPISMIRPRRAIRGMTAILLPFTESGEVDWRGLEGQVYRTVEAGLTPAVNMDTGFVNLIDNEVRNEVLRLASKVVDRREFVAGAYVADQPGDPFNIEAYRRKIEPILLVGGTPVIFQSYGLVHRDGEGIADAYAQIGQSCPRFIAFELGEMFARFGAIYDLETYAQMLRVPQCIGAKHSSLNRELEWQRLVLRDRIRPNFMVLTGNDLAIDMVMYGSDYLLGLGAFAPDIFARRDRMWATGDLRFYPINDVLQAIGMFAFRAVSAYKHSAAQFLKLRGWIDSDRTHRLGPRRPESDPAILKCLLEMLNDLGPQ